MPRNTKRTDKRKRKIRPVEPHPNARMAAPTNILHPLEARTAGQELYLEAIKNKHVVICDGPAGTGKTFISFGCALKAYVEDSSILRIVIVRPTITAGDEQELGFLPGSLNDKMAPFMAPILRDSAPLLIKKIPRSPSDSRFVERFGNSNTDYVSTILGRFDIEIVPLHLMRGRSFHNSFVILDEAQNCKMEDFKLFLTRIGRKSRVVIEGDSTQTDRGKDHGALPELMKRLDGLSMLECISLTSEDIIRNAMISDILERLK